MTIRISTATTDDLPEIVASVDALFATDAGAHNAAATNLRWAAENGIAYYTSLLADSDNLILLAHDDNEAAGHLVGRISGPGSVHPIRVADLESVHVHPAHRLLIVIPSSLDTHRSSRPGSTATTLTLTVMARPSGAVVVMVSLLPAASCPLTFRNTGCHCG